MNQPGGARTHDGITLRQAALIAGLLYLLSPFTTAEFSIMPKLVISGDIQQTVHNITIHGRLFLTAILCYLITFINDLVIAWALYVLLAPVNRSLSLLAAWFRMVYSAIAVVGLFNLVTVYHLTSDRGYLSVFGADQLRAQVHVLLDSFRTDLNSGLVVFGLHLVLVGYLIFRSGYIPKVLGVLVVIAGLGNIIDSVGPYVAPTASLDFAFYMMFGELFLLLWLLIWGWRIRDPRQSPAI